MLRPRIIPVLLLQDGGLVKTTKFDNPSYVGDPLNAVKIFNEKEVDELIVLDIDASKKNQVPNLKLISTLAKECFMPLCYGGGVSSIDQMKQIYELGIEKISINSLFFTNPKIIEIAASTFGSQSLVGSIDCRKSLLGKYQVINNSGKKVGLTDPAGVAKQMESLGIGEILMQSVNRDGTRSGFDLSLYENIRDIVRIPIIACGGANSINDFKILLSNTGVSAGAAGSFFVHQGKHRAVLISYPDSSVIENLLN